MRWIFKDRFNPKRLIIIDNDFSVLLKKLGETFEDFRNYNSMDSAEQKKLISNQGINFAKTIYIHTQISYCLGTHNCQKEIHYDYYCHTVKKYLIDVHPIFAMKKYAEFVAFIDSENDSIETHTLQNNNIDKFTNKTLGVALSLALQEVAT